jgi:hypothetical protein
MGDGKRLYAKIWQHGCHIAAGIAYTLLEEFFDELIVLAWYKAFGIGAFLDDVEGEFARTDTCLLHNGCDFSGCKYTPISRHFQIFAYFFCGYIKEIR